jgi:signal peptidase I
VIISVKVTSGDRLFVDRFTYNFRRPQRGEIIIFETNGIDKIQQGTHYIKRLIGLSGETLRIGDDRHVVADNVRLDASTPHFENVYGIDPEGKPAEDRYSGHVNNIGKIFTDGKSEFRVRPGHYFVMGDNTMNSLDSRFWGDFAQEKVVGKCFFVFWPISSRFGWGVR